MEHLDFLYRALLEYRREIDGDDYGHKFREAIKSASEDNDTLETVRSKCTIEKDWVEAIEHGLPFVDKAIRDERQFIRQEGNVVPIEHTKRVSRASVEHLAKHGNLITHLPEEPGGDVIPDKLYIVEKQSDYAVYENRFLYMLLCYLRDFIGLRYNKINDLENKYNGRMSMDKTINFGKRTITYHTEFSEQSRNDPFARMDPETSGMVKRIADIQLWVDALLNTPLMREVSTAPMIKPPITRTNALKMNNSLRQSLALYDYVAAYNKPGFTVEETHNTYNPFPDDMANDFSEVVAVTSFLVYQYGNSLKNMLDKSYNEEEIRREEQRQNLLRRRIDDLHRRIEAGQHSESEYMLLIEERNKYLEPFPDKLDQANAEIRSLNQNIQDHLKQESFLNDQITGLEQMYAESLEEIKRVEEKCREELAKAEEKRLNDLKKAEEEYQQKIDELISEHQKRVEEINRVNSEQIDNLKTSYEKQIEDIIQSSEQKYNETVNAYDQKINENNSTIQALNDQCSKFESQAVLDRAQLHSLRQQYGLLTDEDDFTSKDRFNELEKEYLALQQLLDQQWSASKKRIRREILWKK